jgi:hypothetical protein
MALNVRIFETDPDSKPQERFVSDIVGRFRSGRMEGRTPVALEEWRVTTGDPRVADRVAAMLGGTPEEWETEAEDNIEVLTDAESVRILVSGPDAIESDLKLWGMNGSIIHHCDGVAFLNEEDRGKPCGCPELLSERKDLAKQGRGPKPDTRISFQLAEAPELGKFEMRSGSWDLVRVLHEYINALEDACDDGPALCTLKLETVSFVPKRGPMAGRTVRYKKPALKIHGPAPVDDEQGVPF